MPTQVRVQESTHKALAEISQETGVPVTKIVDRLVSDYVREESRKRRQSPRRRRYASDPEVVA